MADIKQMGIDLLNSNKQDIEMVIRVILDERFGP